MTELKTLKEIDMDVCEDCNCEGNCDCNLNRGYSEEVLRREAINHIKVLKQDWDNYEGASASNTNVQIWSKDFFIITKEELK